MEQIDPLSRDIYELMSICIKEGIHTGYTLATCQWKYVNYWQYFVPGFDCNLSYLATLDAISQTYETQRLYIALEEPK